MNDMSPIPQNYKKNVDWILRAYTDGGIDFANGFQKDAIQNSHGARKTKKIHDWTVDVSIKTTEKGSFVVVEDTGTVGLTGRNLPIQEINEMMERGEKLTADERLARFSSMFNSGDNEKGGGLYGVGKSVYSVASKDYTYYFDSLRADGKYVANINASGRLMNKAAENEDAKNFILKETGLPPKESVGTRVIIQSPKEDLVDSIKSGKLCKYIVESWWLIIRRFDETSKITVNGKSVTVDFPRSSFEKEIPDRQLVKDQYIVKKFGLYVLEHPSEDWKGLAYYRKGMRIGEIELKNLPEKVKDKIWGYVEVDESWENELADIEDTIHFGVSKGKKSTVTYQVLKNFCNSVVQNQLVEWKIIPKQEDENKKLNNELAIISDDVQSLFHSMGAENLGEGSRKGDFEVRWCDVLYPEDCSEKVTTGDEIKFSLRIKNLYSTDKKFKYKLFIEDPSTKKQVHLIESNDVAVEINSVKTLPFTFKVGRNNSIYEAENRIVLKIGVKGSSKTKEKELVYFYDLDQDKKTREVVDFRLHTVEFPTKGTRRVNSDECIKNISYRLENKRNIKLNYKLTVGINNVSNPTNQEIEKVLSFVDSVEPFEEKVIGNIDSIKFSKEKYENYLSSGKLELRAKITANDDDDQFEKGDKITHYYSDIYFNCSEHEGHVNTFSTKIIRDKDNYKRSWHQNGSERIIFLNLEHPAYQMVEDDDDLRTLYFRELIVKEYVLMYFDEGSYKFFEEKSGSSFDLTDINSVVDTVINKIELIYKNSFLRNIE